MRAVGTGRPKPKTPFENIVCSLGVEGQGQLYPNQAPGDILGKTLAVRRPIPRQSDEGGHRNKKQYSRFEELKPRFLLIFAREARQMLIALYIQILIVIIYARDVTGTSNSS